ncbi:MAG: hypothetical protein ACMXYM_02900 [Candidatus Woesearchaeota archaeon]
MSLPSDLYRSLDGFFHRQVDRVGRVLDRKGVDRSLAGAVASLPACVGSLTFPVVAMVPFAAYSTLSYGVSILEYYTGPNEVRSGSRMIVRDPDVYAVDRAFRAIRTIPAALAAGYAAHGVAALVEGATRGVLEPDGLRSMLTALTLAGPPVSSYLRQRDPLVPEEDPMLAYLPSPKLEPLERLIDP